MSDVFIDPSTADVWKYNDLFTWPNLAVTYDNLAKRGGEDFYSGETMKLMVEDLKSFGSIITEEDFRNYE